MLIDKELVVGLHPEKTFETLFDVPARVITMAPGASKCEVFAKLKNSARNCNFNRSFNGN